MRFYILILMAITTFCMSSICCDRLKTFEKFQEIRTLALELKGLGVEKLWSHAPLIGCDETSKGLFLSYKRVSDSQESCEVRGPWGTSYLGVSRGELFDELRKRFDLGFVHSEVQYRVRMHGKPQPLYISQKGEFEPITFSYEGSMAPIYTEDLPVLSGLPIRIWCDQLIGVKLIYKILSRSNSPDQFRLPEPTVRPFPRSRPILRADYDRLVAK